MRMIATCGLGLEEFLARELAEIEVEGIEKQRGAVAFRGSWRDCWRANWRLRTANRVLVELGTWAGADAESLARGARELVRKKGRGGNPDAGALLSPDRSFAIRATTSQSRITDLRWAALKVKDGLVDGQRDRYRRRSSIERDEPDLSLRLRLHRDQATLTLDTSGESLDHRGYRQVTSAAPVREQLAAACVLASGWEGEGAVCDPMCGSGTLLIEAALYALGKAPGYLRTNWTLEKLPAFDRKIFEKIQQEPLPAPGPDVTLHGSDLSRQAVAATKTNLQRAGLTDRADVRRGDAFSTPAPAPHGLVLINPSYGERLEASPEQWRQIGDLLKQSFRGWRAVVLAGDPTRGKHIGLRPERRWPVMNGPLDARILVYSLY